MWLKVPVEERDAARWTCISKPGSPGTGRSEIQLTLPLHKYVNSLIKSITGSERAKAVKRRIWLLAASGSLSPFWKTDCLGRFGRIVR